MRFGGEGEEVDVVSDGGLDMVVHGVRMVDGLGGVGLKPHAPGGVWFSGLV